MPINPTEKHDGGLVNWFFLDMISHREKWVSLCKGIF